MQTGSRVALVKQPFGIYALMLIHPTYEVALTSRYRPALQRRIHHRIRSNKRTNRMNIQHKLIPIIPVHILIITPGS